MKKYICGRNRRDGKSPSMAPVFADLGNEAHRNVLVMTSEASPAASMLRAPEIAKLINNLTFSGDNPKHLAPVMTAIMTMTTLKRDWW